MWTKNLYRAVSISILALVAWVAGPSCCAQENSEATTTISDDADLLVQELGAPEFSRRERATSELIALGLPAFEAVNRGARSADREIRYRCQAILARLRVFDRQRLMNAFLSRQAEIGGRLPGWDDFQSLVGDSDRSRRKFVELLEAEWDFLELVYDDGSSDAAHQINRRCEEIQAELNRSRGRVQSATFAALMLAAGNESVSLREPHLLLGFTNRNEVVSELFRGDDRDILRRLLGRIAGKRMGEGSVPHQLVLSLRYELDEGLPLAREVINDASHHSFVRQNAILVIAKMGSTDDAKLLTPLLDDDTVCVRSYDIQIRDVALAALIHLANEDFGNYGMSEIQRESTMVFRLTSLRFKSGALREAAIQAWRAKHQ